MSSKERYPEFGVQPDAISRISDEKKLDIYSKICTAREFDLHVIEAVKQKKVIAPVYLSLGQEAVAAAIADAIRYDYIFAGHRAHDLYLSLGANKLELRDELLGLPTGMSGGRAGSSCLKYLKEGIKLMPHHGLIGEQIPQAVGAAISTGEPVITIFGDGAAEEDYVLESFGFAATRGLPIMFLCMDNDLSILTETSVRRCWKLTDVTRSFGIDEVHDVADDPWTIYDIVSHWDRKKPMFINCRVCRERWHSGIGQDGPREWERNMIVREQLIRLGLEDSVKTIENNSKVEMDKLWNI